MSHSDNPSHSTLARRRDMSGLEFFQQMMAGEMPPPPMVALLGLRLAEVEEGRVVFVGTATRSSSTTAWASPTAASRRRSSTRRSAARSTSAMPAGRSFTTLELKMNYTRPLTTEAGVLRCEANVVHVGNRTATAEGAHRRRSTANSTPTARRRASSSEPSTSDRDNTQCLISCATPSRSGSRRGPHHRQPAGQRAGARVSGRRSTRPSRAPAPIPAADAIVLIGAGTTFIAGADIKVFEHR